MAKRFSHIFLHDSGVQSDYTSPQAGRSSLVFPPRNRAKHAEALRNKLDAAWKKAKKVYMSRSAVSLPTREGVYLEFESEPGYELNTQSLEDKRAGIRLLNVRSFKTSAESDSNVVRATVFVPHGKEQVFLHKIKQYELEDTPGKKPKHEKLLAGIRNIRLAVVESFWQDSPGLMPQNTQVWCEIWLKATHDNCEKDFREVLEKLKVEVQDGRLRFPERLVLLAKANFRILGELLEATSDIAEFRRAKETAQFFLEADNRHQTEWVKSLRERLTVDPNSRVVIAVLDTGANNQHVLLEPVLSDAECHAVEPEWGQADHEGHGTQMCGIAAFGDLQAALENGGEVVCQRRC